MIQFHWSLIGDDRFQVKVATPVTRVGTLHRLTAAIYVLGLDIVSGNVLTERDASGEWVSHDNFVLRVAGVSRNDYAVYESTARLGVLMETAVDPELDPASLLRDHGKADPASRAGLFPVGGKLETTPIPERNVTRVYLEAPDRTGLLYHVTRILAEERANIWSAVIVTTDTGVAEDSFYVQRDGRMLTEEESARIRERIRGA